MASLAEKRMEDAEDHPIDQNTEIEARPEELRLLEALLFASAEPIDQAALAKRMPDGVDVKAALAQLQAEYAPRGVNLVRVANKWTFRTAGDLSWLMTRESTETRRLSRAAIEVLAIIAYHQPVPPKDAGPAADVRHDGSVPLPVHPAGARRSAGPGRAEGYGATGFAAAFRLQRSDAVRRRGAARGRRSAGCGRQSGTHAGAGRRP